LHSPIGLLVTGVSTERGTEHRLVPHRPRSRRGGGRMTLNGVQVRRAASSGSSRWHSSPCLVIEVDPTRCRVVGSNQDSGGRPAPPDVHLRTKRSSFSVVEHEHAVEQFSSQRESLASSSTLIDPDDQPRVAGPGANRVKMTPQSVPSWNFRWSIHDSSRRPASLRAGSASQPHGVDTKRV